MFTLRGLKGEVEARKSVEEEFLQKFRDRAACTMLMHWVGRKGRRRNSGFGKLQQ